MKIRTLFTAVALLAMCTAAQAALVSSFEGGLDGWNLSPVAPAGSTVGTSTTPAAAITDGTTALISFDNYDESGTFHELVKTTLLGAENTAIKAGDWDAIEFDLYIASAGGATVSPRYQWSGGGNTYANINLVDGLNHISLDLTSISHTSAWSQLTLRSGAVALGEYYMDNVQLTTAAVPEPATFSLMGLGTTLMWIRRRRR